MAYSQVDPRINDPSLNPADRNNLAIAAGYTGYEDYLNNRGTTQTGYGGMSSADQAAQTMAEQYKELMDEMNKRVSEFETANPFSFDEALAKASAEERYNPYYEAELKDFISGIQRQRQSKEGEMQLLTDLNRVKIGQEARDLEDAIQASEEGYSGAGLYFSGAKERAVGKDVIGAQDTATVREKQFQFGQQEGQRSLTGLAQQEATGVRHLGAEKTTNIQTEIERQRAEEQARWNTEKAQYLGPTYTGSITGGLNQYLQNTFSNY